MNWAEHYGGTSDIPMLHVGGWYDTYGASTLENYLGLARIKKSPIRLLFGPWTHGGNASSSAGEVEFGPEAAMPNFSREFHLQWFDHHLKAKPTAATSWPRSNSSRLSSRIE